MLKFKKRPLGAKYLKHLFISINGAGWITTEVCISIQYIYHLKPFIKINLFSEERMLMSSSCFTKCFKMSKLNKAFFLVST